MRRETFRITGKSLCPRHCGGRTTCKLHGGSKSNFNPMTEKTSISFDEKHPIVVAIINRCRYNK